MPPTPKLHGPINFNSEQLNRHEWPKSRGRNDSWQFVLKSNWVAKLFTPIAPWRHSPRTPSNCANKKIDWSFRHSDLTGTPESSTSQANQFDTRLSTTANFLGVTAANCGAHAGHHVRFRVDNVPVVGPYHGEAVPDFHNRCPHLGELWLKRGARRFYPECA